jgi:glycosyltransferase involved in cell wall biosynthesis
LEALATGVPVVTTAVGGNVELVSDGETGCLVPPDRPRELADRLRQIAQTEELRYRLGQKGMRTVHERFSMERMLADYGVLYERALGCRLSSARNEIRRVGSVPGRGRTE